MSKIKPTSALGIVRADGEVELIDTGGYPLIFVRHSSRGLVIVRSYPNDGDASVETIIQGAHWSRIYNHSPITTRQAALLINRFFKDSLAPYSELRQPEGQP